MRIFNQRIRILSLLALIFWLSVPEIGATANGGTVRPRLVRGVLKGSVRLQLVDLSANPAGAVLWTSHGDDFLLADEELEFIEDLTLVMVSEALQVRKSPKGQWVIATRDGEINSLLDRQTAGDFFEYLKVPSLQSELARVSLIRSEIRIKTIYLEECASRESRTLPRILRLKTSPLQPDQIVKSYQRMNQYLESLIPQFCKR